MTATTLEQTRIGTDAASIVFAQSILDGAALDYCRVTALAAPEEWDTNVLDKKISLSEIRTADFDQHRRRKLDELFKQLDHESLLKKADLLLSKCRPPADWSPMAHYVYDRDRLEKLDRYRHEVIHGESLGTGMKDVGLEIEFMNRTAFYFMGLVNFRYKMMIEPNVAFSATKSSGMNKAKDMP